MFELYKLGSSPAFLPQRVEMIDFSRPVIFQLPDGKHIRIIHPAIISKTTMEYFTSGFRHLAQILTLSNVRQQDFNIYSFRCPIFRSDYLNSTIDALNANPTTYFCDEVRQFVDELLIPDITAKAASLNRDEYLETLRQRFSIISFMGFCYGSTFAEMIGNYTAKHLTEKGYAENEIRSVTDCFYNTSSAAIVAYSNERGWMNSVHSIHAYDEQREEILKYKPVAKGRMVEHEIFSSTLAVTTFEDPTSQRSAKFSISDTKTSWCWKLENSDHNSIFYHNVSKVRPYTKHGQEGVYLKTFQTCHAAGIVTSSIRKGAESSAESFSTGLPRKSIDIITKIKETHLHPNAVELVERRLRRQAEEHEHIHRLQREQWKGKGAAIG